MPAKFTIVGPLLDAPQRSDSGATLEIAVASYPAGRNASFKVGLNDPQQAKGLLHCASRGWIVACSGRLGVTSSGLALWADQADMFRAPWRPGHALAYALFQASGRIGERPRGLAKDEATLQLGVPCYARGVRSTDWLTVTAIGRLAETALAHPAPIGAVLACNGVVTPDGLWSSSGTIFTTA